MPLIGCHYLNVDELFDHIKKEQDAQVDGSKVDMLQQNAKRGKYKIGDIVYTTTVQNGATITRMHVYTGVSLSKQHNNFIDAGKI